MSKYQHTEISVTLINRICKAGIKDGDILPLSVCSGMTVVIDSNRIMEVSKKNLGEDFLQRTSEMSPPVTSRHAVSQLLLCYDIPHLSDFN